MRDFKAETKDEFIKIVRNYYDGVYKIDKVSDMDEMMDFALMHQLNSLYCYMLLGSKGSIECDRAKVMERYLGNIRVNAYLGKESERLSQYLREKEVKFSYIKGQYIRHLYTPCELRSMGDADIYIEKGKEDVIKAYFDANGYELTSYYDDVSTYSKGNVEFELHHTIDWFGIDWAQVGTWDEDGFDMKSETMFTLIHAIKHIVIFGCGVRQVLDVALLLRENSDIFTDSVFQDRVDQLHIRTCVDAFIGVVNKWFGTCYPSNVKEEQVEILENALLDGGVFGKNLNDYATVNTVKEKSKAKMYYRMLFPKYEKMVLSYPILKDKKYLLFFYYIKRLFTRGLKEKRYKIVSSKPRDNATKAREEFVKTLEIEEQYYNKI